jgi:maltokinase
MNSLLRGERPVLAGRTLSVAPGGDVSFDGDRPEAGDGIARELARLVDPSVPTDAAERAIAVDQTNTSVIVDERLVVKVVGRWAAADRAAHLLEHLATAGSTDVPGYAGRVDWRHPSLGTSTLAVVTEYLPGAQDGWDWAVDDVVALLGEGPEPDFPTILGATVARLHDALGADALPAPEAAPTWRERRALDALDAALEATSGSSRPAAARLANRAETLRRDIRSLAAAAPGLAFDVHGDLHVGQVLRSPGTPPRYTVIDFDGDPQLDAAERGRTDAAARDVAHLLVSLDLVAAVVQKRLGRAEPAAWAWADRARSALLDAYHATLVRGDLFDPALVPGFEAEQLAAELTYADRFLPRWRYAPDAAITHRHPSTDDHPEDPWTPPPFEPTST